MDIIEKIDAYRKQRNWSMNRLAVEAELNPGTVLNWFKRRSIPTISAIEAICEAFGITISEFLNEKDAPVYLSGTQKEYLENFDLLGRHEKEDLLRLIKTIGETNKN